MKINTEKSNFVIFNKIKLTVLGWSEFRNNYGCLIIMVMSRDSDIKLYMNLLTLLNSKYTIEISYLSKSRNHTDMYYFYNYLSQLFHLLKRNKNCI